MLRNRKSRQRFAKFCRWMPFAGGCLATVIGVIFLLNVAQGNKDLNAGDNTATALPAWRSLKHIEPIVSAAGQFPDLDIREDFLTINEYSRPGTPLEQVDKIVIHYTGNPATTAQANRDYFESLADNPVTSASSHFVIGTDGEILQCVPLNEIAYASNEANSYSISIECCHPDDEGEFTTETYNQCVALTAALCKYYELDPESDVIRHYDVTGKECPLYYVEHPEEWEMFVEYVKEAVE